MNRFSIDIVRQGHDEMLRAFLTEPAQTGGTVQLGAWYPKNIWDAFHTLGYDHFFIVAKDNLKNRIAGLMLISHREAIFHGKASRVVYISNLKVGTEYKSTVVLARIFRAFREYYDRAKVDLMLFSVFETNIAANQIFLRSSYIRPMSIVIGKLDTYVFAQRKLNARPDPGLKIEFVTPKDVSKIMELLKGESEHGANLPVYAAQELVERAGQLTGLQLNDIAVGKIDEQIVAMAAAWDQSQYRGWMVTGYSALMRIARPLINLMAGLLNFPKLPAINSKLSYHTLSLVIWKQGHLESIKSVLSFLMEHHSASEYFSITLPAESPLAEAFKNRSVRFSSILYGGGYTKEFTKINMKNFYVEQSSL